MVDKREKRSTGSKTKIIPMAMVGAGLLILGIVALIGLPKPSLNTAGTDENSVVPARVNFPAPDLQLKDIQGNTASLKDYRGKVVLVNNWATWCPPCKAEMPGLETYYQKHHGLAFTLIAIEAGEPAEEVSQFIKNYGLSFPVWLDPGNQALDAFNNQALPNSYVIDKNGMVRLAWAGGISLDMLEKYVTPLLKE
ncbi:MAG: TlpA family protein disulfide reductase [Omnitrophica WOR_2 bacterium]